MGSRIKIALTYYHTENWIAGSYYVANLISALNSIDDSIKPKIILLYNQEDALDLIRDLNYPYISYVNTDINSGNTVGRIGRKIKARLGPREPFYKSALAGVHHIFEGNDDFSFIKNHYYWVHDFQQFRLPEFFSKADAENRSALPKKVAEMEDATLILSSYDALNDFNTFFPQNKCKVKIWQFTSSPPDFSAIDYRQQCGDLKIKEPYFICSNQFWQHKNHMVILEALNILKVKNLSFQVVFTGKNSDFRNPKYFDSLQNYIEINKLEPWVNFVGFIDRKVQLCLASHAISYIQPSYFEGWSTSVEDAKYLNQYVLLSDIPVHREQMTYNVSFFDPSDPMILASKMESVMNADIVREKRNYKENITRFGNRILETFLENDR